MRKLRSKSQFHWCLEIHLLIIGTLDDRNPSTVELGSSYNYLLIHSVVQDFSHQQYASHSPNLLGLVFFPIKERPQESEFLKENPIYRAIFPQKYSPKPLKKAFDPKRRKACLPTSMFLRCLLLVSLRKLTFAVAIFQPSIFRGYVRF